MAAKITASLCFSINNNTASLLLCSSTTNSTPIRTRTRRRRNGYCSGLRHFARAPSLALRATSGPNPNEPSSPTSTLQENLNYLLKLAIGSVLGAALIKYGCAAVPEITRPNITQALLMISSPAVVAVLLLVRESQRE